MRIPVSLLKKNENQFPLTEKQLTARKIKIKKETGPELDGSALAMKRKDMISAVAAENPVDAYERYVGKNDLLAINYLQIGTLRSKAVGRLRFTDLTINNQVMATGFLISPDLLMTNHHVFPSADSFTNAQVDFDYAYDIEGNELPKIVFEVDGKKFFYSDKDLDFSIVGIKDTDLTGKHKISERGFLVLNPSTGKAGIGDAATIIQYPDGNYQQIGLRQNEILDVSNPNSLIYQTDTSHGTSGSPVFNDQWQVIALHSAGVARKNAKGQYIDKDGKLIPIVAGQIDTTLIDWISNTGTRISALLKNVFSESSIQNNSYIRFLKSSAYTDAKGAIMNSAPSESLNLDYKSLVKEIPTNSNITSTIDTNGINDKEMNPSISFPNNTGSINIYLGSTDQVSANSNSITNGDLAIESKVLEKTMDYSDCKGFLTKGFMSFETPMLYFQKNSPANLFFCRITQNRISSNIIITAQFNMPSGKCLYSAQLMFWVMSMHERIIPRGQTNGFGIAGFRNPFSWTMHIIRRVVLIKAI